MSQRKRGPNMCQRMISAVAFVALITSGGCATWQEKMDAAMMTAEAVSKTPMRVQYERLREHITHTQEQFARLQAHLSPGAWRFVSFGFVPTSAERAQPEIPGAGDARRYFVYVRASTDLDTNDESAVIAAVDQFYSYAERGEWEDVIEYLWDDRWEARGVTPEGRLVIAEIFQGSLGLAVHSGSYWGDADALLYEVADRMSPELVHGAFRESDEIPRLPEW